MERRTTEQSNYERSLAILSGVYDAAIDNQDYVLFGERECLADHTSPGKLYDLAFHALRVEIPDLKPVTSLVIPVLKSAKTVRENYLNISKINQSHPWINLVGIKYDEVGLDKSRTRTRLTNELMRFWEIKDDGIEGKVVGKRIVNISRGLRIVEEKDLIRIADNPDALLDFLREKREMLNKAYPI